jgi:hypothetical protein
MPLGITANKATTTSPSSAFPQAIRCLPTQSCKAHEQMANPYVNPRPIPWTIALTETSYIFPLLHPIYGVDPEMVDNLIFRPQQLNRYNKR